MTVGWVFTKLPQRLKTVIIIIIIIVISVSIRLLCSISGHFWSKAKFKFLAVRVKTVPVDTQDLSNRNPHKSLHLNPFSDKATRSNKIDVFKEVQRYVLPDKQCFNTWLANIPLTIIIKAVGGLIYSFFPLLKLPAVLTVQKPTTKVTDKYFFYIFTNKNIFTVTYSI